mgnify:CR=1 FL=1
MVTSKFGDEQLFFRHWDASHDFETNPEWELHVPKYTETAGQIPRDTVDFQTLGRDPLVGKDGTQDDAR